MSETEETPMYACDVCGKPTSNATIWSSVEGIKDWHECDDCKEEKRRLNEWLKEASGDSLICPYCDYVVDDCWNLPEIDLNFICPNCGKKYQYTREPTYYSQKRPCDYPGKASGDK